MAPVDALAVEGFQYTPLGEELALVRLLARLDEQLVGPAHAQLIIRRGAETTSHPARACRLGDLGGAPRRRKPHRELLWRASFALSLEIVEYPQALFELAGAGGRTLTLPQPALLTDALPDAAELRSGLLPAGQVLKRFAAVLTVCTVTTASTPAIASAASGGGGGGRGGIRADRQAIHKAIKAQRSAHKLTTGDAGTTVRVAKPVSATTPRRSKPAGATTPDGSKPGRASKPRHEPKPKHASKPRHGSKPTPPTTAHRHAKSKLHPHGADHQVAQDHHADQRAAQHQKANQRAARQQGILPTDTGGHHRSTHHRHEPPRPAPADRPSTLTPAPAGNFSPTPPDTSALSGSQPGLATNPALAHELSRLSTLLTNGDQPPSFLIPIYRAAGRRYHVPWKILAAINAIETDYGRNLNTSSAGAVGWMQFEPGTWRTYGVSTSPKRRPDPYNPADAIYSAAHYLAINGASHDLRKAIFAYNHAQWYVNEVMWKAQVIKGDGGVPMIGSVRAKVAAMTAMADLLVGKPYIWGGGHGGWGIVAGYDCSGFVSAVLHAAGYLHEPQTTDTLPSQPGIEKGPGRYVTIFDRAGAGGESHVIIDLNGKFFESGGSAASGGGAGVKYLADPPADYLASFNLLLHPTGL
ncbi:MAG TPA: lytic transglycosylase domain-containing protein [Solirubrobacteraceae bacterium]